MKEPVLCFVIGTNQEGQVDFFPVQVQCTEEDVEANRHKEAAARWGVSKHGFEGPVLVADHHAPPYPGLQMLAGPADDQDSIELLNNTNKGAPAVHINVEDPQPPGTDQGDPICNCPYCQHRGPLMSAFSYLAAGFNGILAGQSDDVDMQECGNCGARLRWDNVK